MTRSFIGKEHIKPDTGWVVDLPTHLGSTFPTQLGFKPVDEPSTCCAPPLCYSTMLRMKVLGLAIALADLLGQAEARALCLLVSRS
jgi:hypothetical protein